MFTKMFTPLIIIKKKIFFLIIYVHLMDKVMQTGGVVKFVCRDATGDCSFLALKSELH